MKTPEEERDLLVATLADLFGWEDRSFLHAYLHIENAVFNLRAEVGVARALTTELAAALRRAPMPVRESTMKGEEWEMAYEDWWDMNASEVALQRTDGGDE